MKADSVNVNDQEERKVAVSAKAQLGVGVDNFRVAAKQQLHLTPSSARTHRIIFRLRYAANVAATATLTRLDSERPLDVIRYEAAKSLNAVCRLLDRGYLTQDAIDQANRAVTAWLNALPQ
jgi:hypothetical protein